MDAVAELATVLRESEILIAAFSRWFKGEALPLKEIKKVFDEKPQLQVACKRLLDAYGNLATGIIQGVYDEDVIRTARRTDLVTIYERFEAYIKDLRARVHQQAYNYLQRICDKRKSETTKPGFRDPAY